LCSASTVKTVLGVVLVVAILVVRLDDIIAPKLGLDPAPYADELIVTSLDVA
jgi:hypothetical protein